MSVLTIDSDYVSNTLTQAKYKYILTYNDYDNTQKVLADLQTLAYALNINAAVPIAQHAQQNRIGDVVYFAVTSNVDLHNTLRSLKTISAVYTDTVGWYAKELWDKISFVIVTKVELPTRNTNAVYEGVFVALKPRHIGLEVAGPTNASLIEMREAIVKLTKQVEEDTLRLQESKDALFKATLKLKQAGFIVHQEKP